MFDAENTSAAAAEAAQSAARKAQDTATQVEFLKRDVNRLLLISEALWLLLQRANGYGDEDLRKVIDQIELRDAELEKVGKRKAALCPACNRPVSARANSCLYCGQALERDLFGR